MALGILSGRQVRRPVRRRAFRGLGDTSNCSDDDLIMCNQSAYDDASSYCDSISQSGDIDCIRSNMDGASGCACAQAADMTAQADPTSPDDTSSSVPVSVPSTSSSSSSSSRPSTVVSSKPVTSAAPAKAGVIGLNVQTAAIAGVAYALYAVFFGKK